MNKQARFNLLVAAFLLVTLLSAGTAAAQNNTAYGAFALSAPSGGFNSAFGYACLYNDGDGYGNTAAGAYALFSNTTGEENTAIGDSALGYNSTGNYNTAIGSSALLNNTTGYENIAIGGGALLGNTTGSENTTTGWGSLEVNTTGYQNTAAGVSALESNTTGYNNSAVGFEALQSNNGSNNTASGYSALASNTTGFDETASGALALGNNSTGLYNTADGFQALASNTTGGLNTAAGVNALLRNTTGAQDTAVGVNAMLNNKTGSNNISLGYLAGSNLTSGSNNVDIGNRGVAAESNRIRLGTQGTQTAAYIAGISGVGVTGGAPVEVTGAGQLGIVASSARYKHDIRDMGGKSSDLLKLRPVSFRYNNDPANTLQYGLVAEEVAKIYPELVVYGADGKVMTVRYSMLSAMLFNELQKQAQQIETLSAKVAEVEALTRRARDAQKAACEERFSRLEVSTQTRDGNHNPAAAFKQ